MPEFSSFDSSNFSGGEIKIRLISHLHRGRGDLVKAKTLLKEYEKNLIAENFDSLERQLMIGEIVA